MTFLRSSHPQTPGWRSLVGTCTCDVLVAHSPKSGALSGSQRAIRMAGQAHNMETVLCEVRGCLILLAVND